MPVTRGCVSFRCMADNPRKKKLDRKRQSQQPHEVAYRRRKARNKGSNKR
jgi:hypothetical protein